MVLADPHSTDPALAILRRAAEVAQSSEHGIYRMGAIILRGNRLLALGWNKNRTHPKAKNYTRKIHAELDAIIGAAHITHADMYVVRITNGGKMATSKPCRDCEILIREAGIESVTYIDSLGLIKRERL